MYQPRHAKPSCLPARSIVGTGLAAALLPITVASPAIADTTPARSDTGTVGMQDSTPAPEATGTATPAATSTPTAEPSQAPARKQSTELRISGPAGDRAPGKQAVYVRLLADGYGVKDGYVRLERKVGDGWQYVGRLLTKENGLGGGYLTLNESTRLRATYEGSSTREAATSGEIVVKVSALGRRAVQEASRHRGKPYRYGSTGPNSFDCSGFTGYVWRKMGKSLPRTSQQQARATRRVPNSQARPGDLIFTHRNGRVSHVGIYAGNGQMWAAPRSGDVVKLQRVYTRSYFVGRVA